MIHIIITIIVIMGFSLSIIMYFINKRFLINKKRFESDSSLKSFVSGLNNPKIFCENPMELADNEIIFCPESGMYYKKTGKTFIPLISDRNHQIMLDKFGIERTLDIVKVNVSISLYGGTIRDIFCYNVSWTVLRKLNINNQLNNGKE